MEQFVFDLRRPNFHVLNLCAKCSLPSRWMNDQFSVYHKVNPSDFVDVSTGDEVISEEGKEEEAKSEPNWPSQNHF